MSIEIRKATLNDISSLLIITKACAIHMIKNEIYQWNEHYPNKEAFENDIDLEQLYVLESENNIVGCIVLSEIMDNEYFDVDWLTPNKNSIYIHRLAINPDHQGKGLAQQLMSFAEDFAKKHQFLSVRLDTFSINKRNNTFYQKRGYQQLGDVYFPKQSEHPFHCYELVF